MSLQQHDVDDDELTGEMSSNSKRRTSCSNTKRRISPRTLLSLSLSLSLSLAHTLSSFSCRRPSLRMIQQQGGSYKYVLSVMIADDASKMNSDDVPKTEDQ